MHLVNYRRFKIRPLKPIKSCKKDKAALKLSEVVVLFIGEGLKCPKKIAFINERNRFRCLAIHLYYQ